MPLFMDFHQINDLTIDDVKNGHLADQSVQDKYQVRYLQFWVNEAAGTVFCLIEGPDKESCEAVHREAHGNIACSMTEVEPGFYNLMMGGKQKVDHGHVLNEDGTKDSGYRSILAASIEHSTKPEIHADCSPSAVNRKARHIISQTIIAFSGRQVPGESDDIITGVFNEPSNALKCAVALQKSFHELFEGATKPALKIGLSTSQPVTRKGVFFEDAIQLARQLSLVTEGNKIMVACLLAKLSQHNIEPAEQSLFTILSRQDEVFLSRLLSLADKTLPDTSFKIDDLCGQLFTSRTQFYRKLVSLTGQSPNNLLRKLRMNKAVNLLKQKSTSISEIAHMAGFSTPSYFTKCFLDKYGCTPSEYVKTASQ